MPVSNISAVGVSCSTVGAGRWIGQRVSTSSSSPWSIVSPSRLKMRPSVMLPTGTVIGPPVSMTSIPRARPSVVSIATQRTRSSPRCCWTSSTRCVPVPEEMPSASSGLSSRSITSAELISGSCSGKTASITTPLISSIRPTLRPSSVFSSERSCVAAIQVSLRERLSARDDFHDLLRDRGLALAVHLQGVVLDEVSGVLGCVAHRGHARAQLGGGGLEQRAVERDLHVRGHEPLEDLLGVGLVLHERVMPVLVLVVLALALAVALLLVLAEDRGVLEREQRLARHLLGERGDEPVVDDLDAVYLAVDVG